MFSPTDQSGQATSRNIYQRYASPVPSNEDDGVDQDDDSLQPRLQDDHPDCISIHAPLDDHDLDDIESELCAPLSVTSETRLTAGEGNVIDSQSTADDLESRKDNVFIRLIPQISEIFGETCPSLPVTPQVEASARAEINPPEKQRQQRTLPQLLAIKAAFDKVEKEIAGKNPNSLPLLIGKLGGD